MSSTIDAFVQQNRDRLLSELKEFIRIPSISTAPENAADVRRAAEFVAESLRTVGMENVEIIATDRHPLVYADWLHAPGKPTVLCYGHYDVQPADPLELWESPPFEPTERNGNLYARGAVDDKGQMYMHVKAIEALRADVALVSDTAMYAEGMPTLCIGLRGLVYMEIEATGPARDLHSGLYGGAAPNAVYGLIELLAKAKDESGALRITKIYDDVDEPAPAEQESWKRLPFSEREFLDKEVGASQLTGEPDRTVLERVWSRPTFEVHGIAGGFTGAGAKTVIPARATAKASIRLVPRQDPDRVVAAFKEWVKRNTPKGIQTEVRVLSASPGLVVNPEHPAIDIAAKAFGGVFGKETVFIRSGGSIPIVGDFAKHLGIPTILMGFGLPDDGLHSPNEKYKIENYYLGITTIARFFEAYGAS
jgi:acetylornithine deacetylase/succinyl-diaminopimelate desuccinylase-like protein